MGHAKVVKIYHKLKVAIKNYEVWQNCKEGRTRLPGNASEKPLNRKSGKYPDHNFDERGSVSRVKEPADAG